MQKHQSRPPEIAALITHLHKFEIKYVLIGSAAASLYGGDVGEPGDLDITPLMGVENLRSLADLLVDLEARLPDGPSGHWESQPNGERKWVSHGEPTPQELAEREAWRPDPQDSASFDSLFYTRLGNFDVVPDLTGDYEALLPRAMLVDVDGVPVRVVHVDELLTALTVPRREKDRARVLGLREVQRKLKPT